MVIRNKEYYTQFNEMMAETRKKLDYYIQKAEKYRWIYLVTRDRSGIYTLLNRMAEKLNQFYRDRGIKMAKENLKWCALEFKYLQDYISQNEP